jgi:hypothetical protein
MFDGKCNYICFIHLLRDSYNFDNCVDCNSIQILVFCILEWPRGFHFIISLSFLVSFGEVKELSHKIGAKQCSIKYCVGIENNVMLVIQLSQHLLSTPLSLVFRSTLFQGFTVVKKHNVV